MRRIALDLPWPGVGARAGAFGVPGAESRLSPAMRRVHQSRCARALAVELLNEQGAPDVAEIRKDPRGRPQWPANFTGSLSHTDGYALAATASRTNCVALGVDVEPALPLPEDADTLVLTPDEGRWLETTAAANPEAGRLVFCAKECVHKAIEPLRDVWLEFLDVDIDVDLAAGRFTPRPRSPRAAAAFEGLHAQGMMRRVEQHWMLVLALFGA
jgi:4'-phosphopantetheinyl transferase EntD